MQVGCQTDTLSSFLCCLAADEAGSFPLIYSNVMTSRIGNTSKAMKFAWLMGLLSCGLRCYHIATRLLSLIQHLDENRRLSFHFSPRPLSSEAVLIGHGGADLWPGIARDVVDGDLVSSRRAQAYAHFQVDGARKKHQIRNLGKKKGQGRRAAEQDERVVNNSIVDVGI